MCASCEEQVSVWVCRVLSAPAPVNKARRCFVLLNCVWQVFSGEVSQHIIPRKVGKAISASFAGCVRVPVHLACLGWYLGSRC